MNDDEKLIRGAEAKRILSDPIMRQVFEQIEQNALEQMLECPPDDDDGRYRLTLKVQVIREVRDHLASMHHTGLEVSARHNLIN
jgi:hypothetical protein